MISVSHVSKRFGEQVVLRDVSLDIGEGEKVAFIGQSGIGKSVLMKLIVGLLQPDEGRIEIGGEDISRFHKKDWNRVLTRFGVVFQGAALFDSLTVRENVGIRLIEERKVSAAEIENRVSAALASVGLNPAEVLNKYPSELSGGMQKRVGIARAIVHKPDVVFYDEPTTGLDPVNSEKIDQLIQTLAGEKGRTSVIITHDLYTVKKIASKVAMLHDGNIHFLGSPDALFASTDPVIVDFLRRTHFYA